MESIPFWVINQSRKAAIKKPLDVLRRKTEGDDDPHGINRSAPGIGEIKGANGAESPTDALADWLHGLGWKGDYGALAGAVDKKMKTMPNSGLAQQAALSDLIRNDPDLRQIIEHRAQGAQPSAASRQAASDAAPDIVNSVGALPDSPTARQIQNDLAGYLEAGMPPAAARAMAEQNARRQLEQERQQNHDIPPPASPQPPKDDALPKDGTFDPPVEGKADTGSQTLTAALPGDNIATAAKSSLDSLAWKRFGVNDGIPAGVSKDHQFVANTLDKAGFGFDGGGDSLPAATQWADPNAHVPGWSVVSGPTQAGDVLAMPQGKPDHWYNLPGQQMGIATGNDTTIGIRNNNQIAETNWGFRPDDTPTIRRHDSLMAQGTTAPGGDDTAPTPGALAALGGGQSDAALSGAQTESATATIPSPGDGLSGQDMAELTDAFAPRNAILTGADGLDDSPFA